MTPIDTTAPHADPQSAQFPKPHPALQRLERLVGTWELKGRTLNAQADTITGRVVIEWLSGGFFMQQRGEIEGMGFKVQSLEIVGYDPATDTFPSTVYSNLEGVPRSYYWDVQGDVVTHWTEGAKYTGTFSEDGNVLAGGWRPDQGIAESAENTYDAIMFRVK
jgi:hypothetical protein